MSMKTIKDLKNKEVFCENCMHLDVWCNCRHNSNIYYINSAFKKITNFYETIQVLNKNNDCKNFKKGDRYSLWNTFIRSINGEI